MGWREYWRSPPTKGFWIALFIVLGVVTALGNIIVQILLLLIFR